MAYVNCPYCGDQYDASLPKCPMCQAPNENQTCSTAAEAMTGKTVTCPCCGEEYSEGLKECPICNSPNEYYQDEILPHSMAELIDEDGEFAPIKGPRKPVPKQSVPDKNLVLFAFIGVIILVAVLFIKAVSGIVDRSTSNIGAEIFEQRDYYERQIAE